MFGVCSGVDEDGLRGGGGGGEGVDGSLNLLSWISMESSKSKVVYDCWAAEFLSFAKKMLVSRDIRGVFLQYCAFDQFQR